MCVWWQRNKGNLWILLSILLWTSKCSKNKVYLQRWSEYGMMIWNKGHFYLTETAHASLTNLVPDKHVFSHQRRELLCLGSCCAGSPRTSWTLGVLYDSPQVTKSKRIINPIHRQCGANHKQTVSGNILNTSHLSSLSQLTSSFQSILLSEILPEKVYSEIMHVGIKESQISESELWVP